MLRSNALQSRAGVRQSVDGTALGIGSKHSALRRDHQIIEEMRALQGVIAEQLSRIEIILANAVFMSGIAGNPQGSGRLIDFESEHVA